MTTSVPMTFEPHQSFFVVFPREGKPNRMADAQSVNFPKSVPAATLEGAWEVSFNPTWGGPDRITFNALGDWTKRRQRGIKYYSGIATYRKIFDLPHDSGQRIHLDLGTVHDIARVRLNGNDLGVVWCAPWRVEITDVVKKGKNELEIDVANRWINRMRGDLEAPDKGVRTVQFKEGYLGGESYSAGRYTFSTKAIGPGPLLPSGLIGPVSVVVQE